MHLSLVHVSQTLAQDAGEVLESLRALEEQAVKRRPIQRHENGTPAGRDRSGAFAALQQRHLTEEIAALQDRDDMLRSLTGKHIEFAIEDDIEGVAFLALTTNGVSFLMRLFDEKPLHGAKLGTAEEAEDRYRCQEVLPVRHESLSPHVRESVCARAP